MRKHPLKDWDESRRAWKLELGELPKVIAFCRQTFGSIGFTIEEEADPIELTGQS